MPAIGPFIRNREADTRVRLGKRKCDAAVLLWFNCALGCGAPRTRDRHGNPGASTVSAEFLSAAKYMNKPAKISDLDQGVGVPIGAIESCDHNDDRHFNG